MIIAIPADNNKQDSEVCISFGRSPYFLVYDTKTKVSNFIVNNAANSTGGAGIKAAQIIADNKADALLTPRCGQNAADVLKAAGIKLYKTEGGSIKSNIEKFLANELPELDKIHSGFHKNGQ